jgi:hypothetical protein
MDPLGQLRSFDVIWISLYQILPRNTGAEDA